VGEFDDEEMTTLNEQHWRGSLLRRVPAGPADRQGASGPNHSVVYQVQAAHSLPLPPKAKLPPPPPGKEEDIGKARFNLGMMG
jgi:hypothetical protein